MDPSWVEAGATVILGGIAVLLARSSIKRTTGLEKRLNEVEDFRSETMVDVIKKNTASHTELAEATRENTAAIDKLRTHCLMHSRAPAAAPAD